MIIKCPVACSERQNLSDVYLKSTPYINFIFTFPIYSASLAKGIIKDTRCCS